MKNKQKKEEITDTELITLFNKAASIQDKLNIFWKIKDEQIKITLLESIPQEEKYKFFGKLKTPQNIAEQYNLKEIAKANLKNIK